MSEWFGTASARTTEWDRHIENPVALVRDWCRSDRLDALLDNVWQCPDEVSDVTVQESRPLAVLFDECATAWERDTRYVSSMTDVVHHECYRKIIDLGRRNRRQMLSLLLRDTKKTGRVWFTALVQIAGQNPVHPSDAGRVDRMTKAWIKWGKREGLL